MKQYLTGLFFLLLSVWGNGQFNGLLQGNDLSDVQRFYQLTDSGKAVSMGVWNRSMLIRPSSATASFFASPILRDTGKAFQWGISQVSFSRMFNDSVGSGLNNESFYGATGWQERLSAGVYARYKGLELQLQPEWVLAQNKQQAMIDARFKDADFFSRYYFYNINVIDLPSRPGKEKLNRLFPGQSFARYVFNNGLSLGVSTENLWWGPGIRNALVMTNNAPGFLHLSFQTQKPVSTSVGSFEWQMIYGWLDSSGVEPVENERQFAEFWPGAYVPRISQSKRGIAGMVLSWQPKWVPHLYIGFANATYFYQKKTDAAGRPFPDYPYTSSPQNKLSTSLGSLFFRYVMPQEHAEIYAEIGRADKAANLFNLIGDSIPFAYSAGIRKMIPIGATKGFISINAEITHLQLPDPRMIFTATNVLSIPQTRSWYTHPRVRQGYTHHGQLLGAGIGPGSNSQTLHIAWIKGFNRIGLTAERIVMNKDFTYYSRFNGIIGLGPHNQYWVNLNLGLNGQYAWKQFQLAAAITSTSALNHRWVKVDGTFDGPSRSDKRNLQLVLSVAYRPW